MPSFPPPPFACLLPLCELGPSLTATPAALLPFSLVPALVPSLPVLADALPPTPSSSRSEPSPPVVLPSVTCVPRLPCLVGAIAAHFLLSSSVAPLLPSHLSVASKVPLVNPSPPPLPRVCAFVCSPSPSAALQSLQVAALLWSGARTSASLVFGFGLPPPPLLWCAFSAPPCPDFHRSCHTIVVIGFLFRGTFRATCVRISPCPVEGTLVQAPRRGAAVCVLILFRFQVSLRVCRRGPRATLCHSSDASRCVGVVRCAPPMPLWFVCGPPLHHLDLSTNTWRDCARQREAKERRRAAAVT